MIHAYHEKSMRGVGRMLLSVVALGVILAVPFFLRPFAVNGISMETTLMGGDVVLVDTLSLHVIAPRRGEILVFRNPYKVKEGDRIQADVKRVIGLPLETVHVRRDRVVISFACAQAGGARGPDSAPVQPVDGPCQQTFASSTRIGGGSYGDNGNEFDMYLGPHDYFVLGDNRRDSSDSRYFGTVQAENFVGRPIIRMLPLLQFTVLLLNR